MGFTIRYCQNVKIQDATPIETPHALSEYGEDKMERKKIMGLSSSMNSMNVSNPTNSG